MNEDNHYQPLVAGAPGKAGRVIRLVTRIKGVTRVVREAPPAAGKVELSVRGSPERYVFGYRAGGREVADFDWFDYRPRRRRASTDKNPSTDYSNKKRK